MKRTVLTLLVACAMSSGLFAQTNPKTGDPRLRDVVYDPAAVVTVPVKRGMVTLVVLAQARAAIAARPMPSGAWRHNPGAATCSSKPSPVRTHPTTWL